MTKMSTALALGCAMLAAPALAEEAQPVEKDPVAKEAPAFADAKPITEGKLAKIAGREDLTQFNNADLKNSVEGNAVGDNSNTGTIAFSDNAFSEMSGLSIVNANTGNNAAINASIQVNITLPGN